MQIPISCLTEFLCALERGYRKHNNPYHNHIHAADVTQTLHCLLLRSGLVVNHPMRCAALALLYVTACHRLLKQPKEKQVPVLEQILLGRGRALASLSIGEGGCQFSPQFEFDKQQVCWGLVVLTLTLRRSWISEI